MVAQRVRVLAPSGGPLLTQQAGSEETNINTIVARARQGVPMPMSRLKPLYGDFSGITDFHQVKNRILEIEQTFLREIPAKVRVLFGNDPYYLMEWLKDPENQAEAIELGLIEKPKIGSKSQEKPKDEVKPVEGEIAVKTA